MKNKLLLILLFVTTWGHAAEPIDRIHFPSVAFEDMPVTAALTIINEYAGYHDPQTNHAVRGLNVLPIVPATYLNLWTPRRETNTRTPEPTVSYTATNVALRTLLSAVCDQAHLRFETLENLTLIYPKDYSSGPRKLELIDVPISVIRERYLQATSNPDGLKKRLRVEETAGLIPLSGTFRDHGILTDPASFVTYHKPSARAFAYLTRQERTTLKASPLSLEAPSREHIKTMSQTPFSAYSVTNRGAHLIVKDINRMVAAQHPDNPPQVELLASNKEKLTRVSLNLEHSSAYALLQAFTRVTGWTLRNTDDGPQVFARTPNDEWQKNVYKIRPALDTMITKEGPESFFTSLGMTFPPGSSIDYDRNARFLTVRNTRAIIAWLDQVMPRLNR